MLHVQWNGALRAGAGAALVTLLLAGAAAAAEYFVNGSGSDQAKGSSDAPFKTIMRGVTALRPGDKLLIDTGDYKESVTIPFKASEAQPIVVTCRNNVRLLPAEKDGLTIINASYVTVEGLIIVGAAGSGVVVKDSDHCTLSGVMCGGSGLTNVQISGGDFITFEKGESSGSSSQDGVYVSASDHPRITDCKIRENARSGVSLNGNVTAGGNGVITGALVARNIISDNGARGGSAISLDGVEKSTIESNVCDHNYTSGIVAFRSDSVRAGSGNKYIRNVVRFASGQGRFGIALRDGAVKAEVTDSTIAIDAGPAIEVDEASSRGFRASHNFYCPPGKDAHFIWKGEKMDFSGWKNATGQDQDSHHAVVPISPDEWKKSPPSGTQ